MARQILLLNATLWRLSRADENASRCKMLYGFIDLAPLFDCVLKPYLCIQ